MNDGVFDSLVSDFYRAATGEIAWGSALLGVQNAFSARTAILQTVDMRTGQILSLLDGGPPMHESFLHYLREYHCIDPRRNALLAAGESMIDRWWHCHEHLSDTFVEEDPFFQDFLSTVESRYQSTMVLNPAEGVLSGFALELPAARGVLTVDEREWARRLGDHLRDALRANQRVRELTAQALAGHSLLRNFPHPMWLIDAERFIHFANDAACSEAESEARIARHGTHLLLRRTRADAMLTERIYGMQSAPHGATSVIDLRATASDPPTWLHLSLLVPSAVFGAFGDRPLLLTTLFDPRQVSALDPFALSQVLSLTPAQARVAALLAQGQTVEQIAASGGTSVATVRTHIRKLLLRLGANRVTDLVRMLRQGEALWAAPASRG